MSRLIPVEGTDMRVGCVLLALCFISAVAGDASDDLITGLPGLGGITPNFQQYSGYLDAGNGIMLHYW